MKFVPDLSHLRPVVLHSAGHTQRRVRQGQLAPHTHYPPQLPPYSKSTAAALAECSGWLWLLVQHSCPFKDSVIVYRGLALLPQDPCPYKIPYIPGQCAYWSRKLQLQCLQRERSGA